MGTRRDSNTIFLIVWLLLIKIQYNPKTLGQRKFYPRPQWNRQSSKTSDPPSREINLDTLFSNDVQVLADVEELFSEEEIHLTLFNLPSDKASSPDGFLLRFYQHFRNTTKGDILWIANGLINDVIDLHCINTNWITLIPKTVDASSP